MLLAIAALLVDNLHLRNTMRQATVDRAALQQRESDLRPARRRARIECQTASELDQVRNRLPS